MLLAALVATAARLVDREECTVLMPYANRVFDWARGVIGPCLNSLYLTAEAPADLTFGELVDAVRDIAFTAYEDADVPAEALRAHWSRGGAEARSNLMLNLFPHAGGSAVAHRPLAAALAGRVAVTGAYCDAEPAERPSAKPSADSLGNATAGT